MNTQYETITIEIQEDICTVTINRPKQLNALNKHLLEEMGSFIGELRSNFEREVKGLIITGEGEKAFVAGADIKEMMGMNRPCALNFGRLGQKVGLEITNLKIPVISAVNGYALGGGLELAMCADLILASENAVFGLPEVSLGLIPGFGGTQRLSRLVGLQKAKELIFTGKKVKAMEAKEIGLVLEVYSSREELLKSSHGLMKKIFKNSREAVKGAKKAINFGREVPLLVGLDKELEEFGQLFGTKEMVEGTQAFLEKREPNFS